MSFHGHCIKLAHDDNVIILMQIASPNLFPIPEKYHYVLFFLYMRIYI